MVSKLNGCEKLGFTIAGTMIVVGLSIILILYKLGLYDETRNEKDSTDAQN